MNRPLPFLAAPLLAATALLLAAPAATQSKKPTTKPSWPKLSAQDAAKARGWVRRLDFEDEDSVGEVEAKLKSLGPGVAREMLRELDDREEAKREFAIRVLDTVLTREHAMLLVPLLEDDGVHTRRYVALRIARFHTPAAKTALSAALEDKDSEVAFRAALALAGLGEQAQLEAVFARSATDWRKIGATVTEVLAPARSPEALRWLTDKMRGADESTTIACLRLMRSLCPKDHAGVIAIHLDSTQHSVKRAAINALRAVVDGDPPIDNLSVFQGIADAKKWKERL